jgi:hypothetical protein
MVADLLHWTFATFLSSMYTSEMVGSVGATSYGVRIDALAAKKFTDPIAAGNFVPPNNFNPGVANQIVVVRLFYKWPIFVTKLGFNIANLTGGKRLLTATAAFKNEPF